MSGTITPITIGVGGTDTITTPGTYDVSVSALSTLDIVGSPGTAPIAVTVSESGLLSLGLLDTTNISNADEVLTALAGVSAASVFNLGTTGNIGTTGVGVTTGNGTLELGSGLLGVTALDSINLYGTNDKVILDSGLNLNLLDSLHNFTIGDTIEIKAITTATQAVFTPGLLGGGTVTLENAGGTPVGSIVLANGSFASNAFHVVADPNGGVDLTVCFLEGTRLLGLHRDIAVEDMEVGDRLITDSGAMRPVRWVGKRSIDTDRHPHPESVWPIRIGKGAIAEGLPERPLYLSPDHALYLDGHLIPAKALVNGRSIVQERRRHITYYHIELETHDVLLAESLPVESYLETGNRNFFENGGGVIVLHPNIAQALREAKGCAPFAERGPVVTAVRDRINRRLPALPRTTENAMRAVAAGLVLPITVIDATTYRIDLPADVTEDILLLSHAMIPADIDPASEDRRRLGLDIARLTIEAEDAEQQIMLDSPLLREGWHVNEANHRWTNGAALIPAALFEGASALTVHLSAPTAYPVLADRDTALNAG